MVSHLLTVYSSYLHSLGGELLYTAFWFRFICAVRSVRVESCASVHWCCSYVCVA